MGRVTGGGPTISGRSRGFKWNNRGAGQLEFAPFAWGARASIQLSRGAMKQLRSNRLEDIHHRKVDYLRLSVTDRCNLSCRYCAPSLPKPVNPGQILSFEEMERLVTIGVGLGITKVRLTGGEPLFRRGIVDFIGRISGIDGLRDISLTTNGTLLFEMAEDLKDAGVKRINISLDTLEREKFREMAGRDRFEEVWKGIMRAHELGFDPVKINVVVMKGFNDCEISRLSALSMDYPFHVRFIEYMPIGTDPSRARDRFLPVEEIRKRVAENGRLIPVDRQGADGPAKRYRIEGAMGEVGFIGSMSRHFCESCNRLRLTSRGALRPCLLADKQVDVITALRGGASDDELGSLFVRALRHKKGAHGLSFAGDRILKTKMVSIGG